MQRVFDIDMVPFAGDMAEQHPVDAVNLPVVDKLALGMCHLKRWASRHDLLWGDNS